MSGEYDDIIDLPRHISKTRKQMSQRDRAAQFSPFAALDGYEEVVEESARLTEDELILDESEIELLNGKLTELSARISERPFMRVRYFVPDEKKSGGSYRAYEGKLRIIDVDSGRLIFEDGSSVDIARITEIES